MRHAGTDTNTILKADFTKGARESLLVTVICIIWGEFQGVAVSTHATDISTHPRMWRLHACMRAMR
jgi:hypothetical protein